VTVARQLEEKAGSSFGKMIRGQIDQQLWWGRS
jgi:hypothetical protein